MSTPTLRPTKLSEFKGKKQLKDNLSVYLKSCTLQNKPLEHTIFYGPPGTGKTTLATVIANELHRNIRIITGSNLQHNSDLLNIILTINEFDIIFIDEIHAMNPLIYETLYSALEDFTINICLGKDMNARITKLQVPKFTLIGATNILGKLPPPLEQRFGIIFHLKTYTLDEIEDILKAATKKLELSLTSDEITLISKNCKGIPRNAVRIISRVKDFRLVDPTISVNSILKKLQIIANGVNYDDLNYMRAIYQTNRALGLKTISQIVSIDLFTLETYIEPFLISNQYVEKTTQGRTLTPKGKDFVKTYKSTIAN
jgi:Holliday junction DNA helicase RuvB